MSTVKSMFIIRAGRLASAGIAVQIMYESLIRAGSGEDPKLHGLFNDAAAHLSDHFLVNKAIKDKSYKVVAFSLGQFLISMVSEVEAFFSDVMFKVLTTHPRKISKMNLELSTVLSLGDYKSIIEHAAQRRCIEIMYKSPGDYKKDFLDILSADVGLLDKYWDSYAEAKARRDLGVHNDWKTNEIYRSKAGPAFASQPPVEFMIPSLDYALACRRNCVEMMEEISAHCTKKLEI